MAPRGFTPVTAARDAAARLSGDTASNWQSTLARWGLVAKGMLYIALGILAMSVAAGDAATGSATQRGAIELVARQPFGQGLLIVMTFGLFSLAIWQALLTLKGDPVDARDRTRDRLKYAVKALVYGSLATTALAVLRGTAGAAGGAGEDRAAATVMNWPGGVWIVALLGAVAIAIGLNHVHRHAIRRAFMNRLARGHMSSEVEKGVERAGRLGYAARGIVFAIVGIFLIVAAIRHDPREAIGLSGALQVLAGQAWGQAVMWVVAIGLFMYGCFCFAEARYRRAA